MKVSFLIPTKDRLSLLRHTIASIVDQSDQDVEIVVADNASSEDYESYVSGLGDSRIVYFRQSESVSVTENWQRALSLATGDYVLMLGDDDALAPDFMACVRPFLSADLIYVAAYHYCYPDVIPTSPNGYLASVLNSEFLSADRSDSFKLEGSYARGLADSVLNFHLRFGMNAQHFLLKASFARSFDKIGGIYQSPYPDTFAAVAVWLHATSIVVVPKELVIIGISPKSFGAYYFSGRHEEGYRFLDNERLDAAVRDSLADVILPGDRNNTNWLIAVASAKRAFSTEMEASVGIARYRTLQIMSVLSDSYLRGNRKFLDDLRKRLSESEYLLVNAFETLLSADANDDRRLQASLGAVLANLRQYEPAKVTALDIGRHSSISDAYFWLKRSRHSASKLAPTDRQDAIRDNGSSQEGFRMPDRARNLLRPVVHAFPPLRQLYHAANRLVRKRGAVPLRNDEPLSIAVDREGSLTRLDPSQFDEFKFCSGDVLSVKPESKACELLRTPEGHYHIQVGPDVGVRVPPKISLIPFRGFAVPEHLVALTGAGFETFDAIGKAHIANYSKFVGLDQDMTLVEIGSGIGRDAIQLVDLISPKGSYLGIDVQRESIVWCQQNISRRHPNFKFVHFNAHHELHNPLSTKTTMDFRIPLPDQSVDRVVAGSVLTHIFKDEVTHYFREIARVLKPTGLTYLTFFLYTEEAVDASRRNNLTPYNLRFEHVFGPGCYVNDPQFPTGAVAYTGEAMREMIDEAGLKLARPFLKGLWSGLYPDGDDGQDVAILRI
jgi:glycosyltransferase involved in cell wall biosynthesis/SAM-dependent methyltransferase